jgi:hypothetical protein
LFGEIVCEDAAAAAPGMTPSPPAANGEGGEPVSEQEGPWLRIPDQKSNGRKGKTYAILRYSPVFLSRVVHGASSKLEQMLSPGLPGRS